MSKEDSRERGWKPLKNNFNTRQRCTGTHTPTLHTPSEDTHVNVAQVKLGQNWNSYYTHNPLQRNCQFQGVGNAGVCVNMIYHGPQVDGAGTCFTESMKKRGGTAVGRFWLGKTIDGLSAKVLFPTPALRLATLATCFS